MALSKCWLNPSTRVVSLSVPNAKIFVSLGSSDLIVAANIEYVVVVFFSCMKQGLSLLENFLTFHLPRGADKILVLHCKVQD